MKIMGLVIIAVALGLSSCDQKVTSSATCGDGVIDTGEECDPDAPLPTTCLALGYNGGQLACNSDCSFIKTECEVAGICGDGTIQSDYESCDGDNIGGQTCFMASQGDFQGGTLACDDNCQFDFSECVDYAICGDNAVGGSEECDGDDLAQESCMSLGYYGGTLDCRPSCEWNLDDCELHGRCGDLVAQGEEECDDADLANESCESLGYYGGILACGDDCIYDTTSCASFGICGDGVIQASMEACDLTDINGATCDAAGYFDGTPSCLADCSAIDLSTCTTPHVISTTYRHHCQTSPAGALMCWGNNIDGALGIGSTTNQASPVQVISSDMFTTVTAGNAHTCALTTTGEAWCWGANYYGTVGDGTSSSSKPLPTLVTGAHTFRHISAGDRFSCALDDSDYTWCWGYNDWARLGTVGDANAKHIPTLVHDSTPMQTVECGYNHACAIALSGETLCWGFNGQGQRGRGDRVNDYNNNVVVGGHSFTTLSLGQNFTCALTAAGVAWCWGVNHLGQLGMGSETGTSSTGEPTPLLVAGGLIFSAISAGTAHACGLDAAGAAWCWGSGASGALGTGTTDNSPTPVAVTGGLTFTTISAGDQFTCGITTAGETWCWGNNPSELGGIGSVTYSATPILVQ